LVSEVEDEENRGQEEEQAVEGTEENGNADAKGIGSPVATRLGFLL
jgi:hypothetical protein